MEEQWIRSYRYKVSNGIRIVGMSLKHHLPSHLTIAGNRVLVSYEVQPRHMLRVRRHGSPIP